jgi:hypothetical protein
VLETAEPPTACPATATLAQQETAWETQKWAETWPSLARARWSSWGGVRWSCRWRWLCGPPEVNVYIHCELGWTKARRTAHIILRRHISSWGGGLHRLGQVLAKNELGYNHLQHWNPLKRCLVEGVIKDLKFNRYCIILSYLTISVQLWTSRKLLSSYVFSFVNSLYLILYIYVFKHSMWQELNFIEANQTDPKTLRAACVASGHDASNNGSRSERSQIWRVSLIGSTWPSRAALSVATPETFAAAVLLPFSHRRRRHPPPPCAAAPGTAPAELSVLPWVREGSRRPWAECRACERVPEVRSWLLG